MVKVNGENIQADNLTLMDFLPKNGYVPQKIAVEMNGEIVPKSQYNSTILRAGDALEIVNFVGGG